MKMSMSEALCEILQYASCIKTQAEGQPCQLPATNQSIHSQLPSTSRGCLLHSQAENAHSRRNGTPH